MTKPKYDVTIYGSEYYKPALNDLIDFQVQPTMTVRKLIYAFERMHIDHDAWIVQLPAVIHLATQYPTARPSNERRRSNNAVGVA